MREFAMQYTSMLIGLFAVAAASCSAFSQEIDREAIGFLYRTRPDQASAIASLPPQVVAPDGHLSLYADYANASDGSVPLYLVNRTTDRIGFNSQDRDIYLKLEALMDDSVWERAQTHFSSGCGNSYMVFPILRPGEYFSMPGYFPSGGERRTVRYRIYNDAAFVLQPDTPDDFYMLTKQLPKMPLDIVSNAGVGMVPPAAIAAARRDDLAIRYGTFNTIRAVIRGSQTSRTMDRNSAIEQLGRFPTEESLGILRELLAEYDRETVGQATRALARMSLRLPAAESYYQELLHAENLLLRFAAIMALTERPVTADVITFAKSLLTHDDLYVRCAGMNVIASECKKNTEIKAFIDAIYDDPNPKIQSIFETILYPGCIDYEVRGRKGKFRER
jgi:hypothetical protein